MADIDDGGFFVPFHLRQDIEELFKDPFKTRVIKGSVIGFDISSRSDETVITVVRGRKMTHPVHISNFLAKPRSGDMHQMLDDLDRIEPTMRVRRTTISSLVSEGLRKEILKYDGGRLGNKRS